MAKKKTKDKKGTSLLLFGLALSLSLLFVVGMGYQQYNQRQLENNFKELENDTKALVETLNLQNFNQDLKKG